ncbi:MAG TPA: AGE family epimerase/isomerase [Fimbriimonas sp.]|nr:AGE family epimerase/isomerase [Fimbriimonas sp.]
MVPLKEEPLTPQSFADEIEAAFWRDVVDAWFPACIDARGGFHQNFDRQWRPTEDKERFLVFQTRMIWLASTVSELGGRRKEEFAAYARHGVRYLAERMFEPASGACYGAVDLEGQPFGHFATHRETYGLAFAVFGLAAASRVLKDDQALGMAKAVFTYLETCHRDGEHGGYFECTDANGVPVLVGAESPGSDFPFRRKSQNSHLHLLEAFTELYRVWRTPLVGKRLRDMVSMFCGEFYGEPGHLHMYLDLESKPIEGSVTFGHDVEVAHLLDAALEVLGAKKHEQAVLSAAKQIQADPSQAWLLRGTAETVGIPPFQFSRAFKDVTGTGFHPFVDLCRGGTAVRTVPETIRRYVDHSLQNGWDQEGGGFYALRKHEGDIDRTKIWWVQAEGLLALAVLFRETGSEKYWHALLDQWNCIKRHQIDSEWRGLFEAMGADGVPLGRLNKGHRWKAGYHDGRAFLFVPQILRKLTRRA